MSLAGRRLAANDALQLVELLDVERAARVHVEHVEHDGQVALGYGQERDEEHVVGEADEAVRVDLAEDAGVRHARAQLHALHVGVEALERVEAEALGLLDAVGERAHEVVGRHEDLVVGELLAPHLDGRKVAEHLVRRAVLAYSVLILDYLVVF